MSQFPIGNEFRIWVVKYNNGRIDAFDTQTPAPTYPYIQEFEAEIVMQEAISDIQDQLDEVEEALVLVKNERDSIREALSNLLKSLDHVQFRAGKGSKWMNFIAACEASRKAL